MVFVIIAFGTVSWMTLFWFTLLFGGFVLYLRSGWFAIDLSNPWFPLRRDDRGKETQRKALLAAVITGLLLSTASGLLSVEALGHLALPLATMTYFGVQFLLFSKA